LAFKVTLCFVSPELGARTIALELSINLPALSEGCVTATLSESEIAGGICEHETEAKR
jgi:hypothetical protein